MNTTSAASVASSTPDLTHGLTPDLTSALQDMVRQLLLDAPSVQAAAQPLCLCWVEGQS